MNSLSTKRHRSPSRTTHKTPVSTRRHTLISPKKEREEKRPETSSTPFDPSDLRELKKRGKDALVSLLKDAEEESDIVKKILSLSRVEFLLFNGNVPSEKREELAWFDGELLNVALFHPTKYLEKENVLKELPGEVSKEDVLLFLEAYKEVFSALYWIEQQGRFFFPHLKISVNTCPVSPIPFEKKKKKNFLVQNNTNERVLNSTKQISIVIPSLGLS